MKINAQLRTEATILARNMIKIAIRREGRRITDFTGKQIREATEEYLKGHPSIYKRTMSSLVKANSNKYTLPYDKEVSQCVRNMIDKYSH